MWKLSGLALFFAATCAVPQSRALVGPTTSGDALAPHVVMVLKRSGNASGFCSGVVVAREVILTAAHCVAGGELRILVRDDQGRQQLAEVADSVTHPGFRPNAPKTRERSIDLGLVRTSAPLPASYVAASMERTSTVAIGAPFRIAGFGLGVEGSEKTAGVLRQGLLAASSPLSSILLWAKDPVGKGLGACTGDSGGPIFEPGHPVVVGITVWATGAGKKNCGALTQAVLVGPQRAWIDATLAKWGAR